MSSERESIPSAKTAPSAPKTATEDVTVTLKVYFEGFTQRHKLGLRDVGVSSLETKVREFLQIPPTIPVLLERYSDSAAAYIVLDPKNTSVYKQLYRAAKAKQKLKLRVTAQLLPERTPPRPVTVEDDPEVNTTPAAVPSPAPQSETSARAQALKAWDEKIFDLLGATDAESRKAMDIATRVPAGAPPPPQKDVDRCFVPEPKVEAPKHQLPMANLNDDFETSLLASLMQKHANISSVAQKEPVAKPVTEKAAPKSEAPAAIPSIHGFEARDSWFARAAGGNLNGQCPARLFPTLNFAVCCNSCDKTIPDSHYHCSTCDDGDFDLCQSCVDQGITCYSDGHWLIKRVLQDGQIVTSTTETIAPKPKKKQPVPAPKAEAKAATPEPFLAPLPTLSATSWSVRTCNCCVNELPETSFLHCTTCEDFDLCHACFSKDAHGHHPKHAFTAAIEGAYVPNHLQVRLSAGRNQVHNAICDGCDKYICGVRHKCLDCPDWDYCSECILNAKFVHANHRFVPVYEPLEEARVRCASTRQVHYGICCDGPLCSSGNNAPTYITGTRYKCTVCHDTDFCANCEANPATQHNKTHPLVQFKTPVRHVTVTTTGEHGNGHTMPQLGDRSIHRTTSRSSDTKSMASVQTVVDVKPEEPTPIKQEVVEKTPEPKIEVKKEKIDEKPAQEKDLVAVFVSDTIADGTTMAPNSVFQQTWNLRNDGDVAWPAGCSVKFVGGDYMGHVDSNQPAGISELVSASESTICYEALAPGQEAPFTVLLRTPPRDGKVISYWRLTTNDGLKFGHRLWCDIDVRTPKEDAKSVPAETVKEEPKEEAAEEAHTSQMIFPKLDKESPMSSVHQDAKSETAASSTVADAADEVDDFEDCGRADDWEGSDDGFMTDEEYDILDASDEEYLEEQQKRLRK
ncbi:hypothetical protein ACHAQA_002078 [Verticillium albo-atrum]